MKKTLIIFINTLLKYYAVTLPFNASSHASLRLIMRSFSIHLNESGIKSLSRLGDLNRGFVHCGITV